jgi:hypothetical protein
MNNCFNRDCRLCKNAVISQSVTLVTVDGVDTLVIDIPAGFYADKCRYCVIVAQNLPTNTPITAPVSISIGGDTTTVYPVVNCDCSQVTACGIRARTKYGLILNTSATSGVFKSVKKICCRQDTLSVIPAPTTTGGGA